MYNYISIRPSLTASIVIPGYMIDKTTAVYIQTLNNSIKLPNTTLTTVTGSYTTNPLVSALFPPLTAYSHTSFNILNKNELLVNVSALSGSGYADIIIASQAGYTKMSNNANTYIRVLSS